MESGRFHPLSPELEAELKATISQGLHIGAIKRFREATGCGLAEAAAWLNETLAAGGFVGRWPGNPCPHCGSPLRTDFAQQCFECGADWHKV